MSTYLMTKDELENNSGLQQIATDVVQMVKFEADDSQFDQLNPAPDSDTWIRGTETSQGTEIRLPHEALGK